MAWLESRVSDVDSRVLGFQIGSASAQAAFEALAILVALRAWAFV